MAPKVSLKPLGALAEQVSKAAAKHPPVPNGKAAAQALLEEQPDIAAVLSRSGYNRMIARLLKASDQVIAGEAAVQVIANLQADLVRAGLRFTGNDLARCLKRTLQLQTARGGGKFRATAAVRQGAKRARDIAQGYAHEFSGELRERVVQHLPQVRLLADTLRSEAQARARAKGGRLIDTGLVGDVRLATAPGSGSPPAQNMLGPDRLIGFIERDKAALASGFAGTLHVTAIIEVKAITGGHGGLNQLQAFLARASHGELTIGQKTYRIEFDEKALKRVVILPETAKEAREIAEFAKANGIELLPYAQEIEETINAQTRLAVNSLLQLDQLLR